MFKKKEKKAEDPNKIGAGNLILWSCNGVSVQIQVLVLGYLTVYCTNALGLDAALVGTLLMASKIIDSISDILAGYVVDRTNTRWGRGRPYDFMIIGLWFTTWLLYSVPTQFSLVVKCVWIVVCYALCQSFFKTFLTAAGNPYMVRAFNNNQKYIKLGSWGAMFCVVFIMIFNVTFPMLYAPIINDASGWSRMVGYLAVPLAIIGLLRFFFIKEKYDVDTGGGEKASLKDVATVFRTNKNIFPIAMVQLVVGMGGIFSSTVLSYYFLYIVGNVSISGMISMFQVIAMLSLAFYPVILRKISVKHLIQWSLYGAIAYGLLNFFAVDNFPMLCVAGVIVGFVSLPASYMFNMLIIDCADYNEWKLGPRLEGSMTAITGFANKLGSALGTFVVGVLLSWAGFNGTLDVQPDSAIMMIRLCYSLVPMAFYLIAGLSLNFFKLDKIRPEMNAALAEKRAKYAKTADTEE
ncbi:MAG: MFS transporter [Clostridiales bacterium]|nr:MFS transporter [Clostridiales bacterium]